jgi:hypothetical protein
MTDNMEYPHSPIIKGFLIWLTALTVFFIFGAVKKKYVPIYIDKYKVQRLYKIKRIRAFTVSFVSQRREMA